MSQEKQQKSAPIDAGTLDEPLLHPNRTIDPHDLHMPMDSDPAGDGHMFMPGPDWPPPRTDKSGGDDDPANDVATVTGEPDQPSAPNDLDAGDGVSGTTPSARPGQPASSQIESTVRDESAMPLETGIIIVTGSNGRIGDAVMRRLSGQFPAIVGFDRKAPQPPPPGCVYVPVDVTSDDSVREGLMTIRDHHGARVASVIHLAAYYDFFGAPSPMYDEITVRGTQRMLRALQELNFDVDQFIFSSTMLVHKPAQPGQFINEEWPLGPTWAYPESKVRTEQVIREGRGDIPAVLLRISGVYDDRCHSIPLANQIQRIYERDLTSRLYSGSTAHAQAFMHMDDLVDAIELTVARRADLPPEVPILLGEPEALNYDELQHTMARLIHGDDWETIEIPGPLAPVAKLGAWVLDHVPGQEGFIKPWMIDRANDHYVLDVTRARELLGWEPKRSLRETLPKMIAALKADPLTWYEENELKPPSSLRRANEQASGGAADER